MSKTQSTILIVDDDPVQRRLAEAAITRAGYDFLAAEDGRQALELLAGEKGMEISVVVLDLVMPELDGMGVLTQLREQNFSKPVIVLTSQGGVNTVVEAMRLGAFDFLIKPIAPEKLGQILAKAIKFAGSATPERIRQHSRSDKTGFDRIIYKSPVMDNVMRICQKAAGSDIPVMIEGESGVGKELIAKAIQVKSARADGPFITVNCGALPENLVESILFGHEKGAFTGAATKHVGKFEEADGGTLMLDEIGELPLDTQVKLLRAIQEGEIDPIGAKRPVTVNVRLISATNRTLLDEVKQKRFREDLYYRLNVLPVSVPALLERRDDIGPLVNHFVKRLANEENKPNISAIHPDLMSALKAYDWPGNIRELENAIFRAIVLCDGDTLTLEEFPQIAAQLPGFTLNAPQSARQTIEQAGEQEASKINARPAPENTNEHLMTAKPPEDELIGKPAEPISSNNTGTGSQNDVSNFGMVRLIADDGEVRSLQDIEADAIRFAIEVYGGKMSKIARHLDIGRSTLYRKLKEHQLDDTDQNEVA